MVALGFKKNRVPVHVCNRERLCGSVVGRTFTPRSFFIRRDIIVTTDKSLSWCSSEPPPPVTAATGGVLYFPSNILCYRGEVVKSESVVGVGEMSRERVSTSDDLNRVPQSQTKEYLYPLNLDWKNWIRLLPSDLPFQCLRWGRRGRGDIILL